MIVHEMKEPLPVETSLGKGLAILVTIGTNDNTWTIVLENRAIVDFKQRDLLVQRDFTNRRGVTSEMMIELINRRLNDL